MQSLLNSGDVTIPDDFTLIREGVNNYSVVISKDTVISGGNSWDGKIILPTVKINSDYSILDGSINTVIDLGGETELTFSEPVKVTIGGMAGQKAAWTRGTGSMTKITTVCNSLTNPTNINSVSPRECYIDEGNDLVIWTYHFTEFGTYQENSQNNDQSSSSSGYSPIKKINESSLVNDKPEAIKLGYPNTAEGDKIVQNENKADEKGFVSGVTGAVVGALTSGSGIVVIIFIIGLMGSFVGVRSFRKKRL